MLKNSTHRSDIRRNFIRKTQKVAFLYISINKELSGWKKLPMKSDFSIMCLLPIGDAYFVKKKKIKYSLRYVLFGKDREILNSNAPRPNDKDWNALILK